MALQEDIFPIFRGAYDAREKYEFDNYLRKARKSVELLRRCGCNMSCQVDLPPREKDQECIGRCFENLQPCPLRRVRIIYRDNVETYSQYCEYHTLVCQFLTGGYKTITRENSSFKVIDRSKILGYAHEFVDPYFERTIIAKYRQSLKFNLTSEQSYSTFRNKDPEMLKEMIKNSNLSILILEIDTIIDTFEDGIELMEAYFSFLMAAKLRYLQLQFCTKSPDYSHVLEMITYYNIVRTFNLIMSPFGFEKIPIDEVLLFTPGKGINLDKFFDQLYFIYYILKIIDQNKKCLAKMIAFNCLPGEYNPMLTIQNVEFRNKLEYIVYNWIVSLTRALDISTEEDAYDRAKFIIAENEIVFDHRYNLKLTRVKNMIKKLSEITCTYIGDSILFTEIYPREWLLLSEYDELKANMDKLESDLAEYQTERENKIKDLDIIDLEIEDSSGARRRNLEFRYDKLNNRIETLDKLIERDNTLLGNYRKREQSLLFRLKIKSNFNIDVEAMTENATRGIRIDSLNKFCSIIDQIDRKSINSVALSD